MKKVIILNWILKIFIAILILAIPINQCLRYNISNEALTVLYKDSVFGNYTPYIILLRIAVVIIALLNTQKALKAFIKDGYFNLKSSLRLKRSGSLLLIISIIGLIISILDMKQSSERDLLLDIIIYLLIVAISLGLLAFADVIKKGNIIEIENNLTI